ncbi:MAG: 50S ribosomal protein L11 methyltransferase [Ruminococcus sp.]|jgi:ribosomal protein L11 methyltransferase|nr:50S ribosomal protein L11 methyltransferase [Ruminococcus sp.]
MNWIELKIYCNSEEIELLTYELQKIGITGFEIHDPKDFLQFQSTKSSDWDYIEDDIFDISECFVTVYLPDDNQGAERCDFVKSLGKRITEKIVKETDWANNWKQYFKPFEVGRRLIIKPSWEEITPIDSKKVILEIDPASSFGTGQHHTTKMCLEVLDNVLSENNASEMNILDLGCGSGILGIAAILLGAKTVTAVDIQENSIKIAKENFDKNRIPRMKFSCICGNVIETPNLISGKFDIIIANIVADVLIGMSDFFPIKLKENGILIVSGIIENRLDDVKNAMKNNFKLEKEHNSDDWYCLEFKKYE